MRRNTRAPSQLIGEFLLGELSSPQFVAGVAASHLGHGHAYVMGYARHRSNPIPVSPHPTVVKGNTLHLILVHAVAGE